MSVTPLPEVPRTKILAIGRFTEAGSMEAVAPLRPMEVRATVALHLAGHIEQWWYQVDARGPVFLLNLIGLEEARRLLEELPLGKAGLMTFDLITLGPLRPLAVLL